MRGKFIEIGVIKHKRKTQIFHNNPVEWIDDPVLTQIITHICNRHVRQGYDKTNKTLYIVSYEKKILLMQQNNEEQIFLF